MERRSNGTYIKKGPWTAEEDEVLMNYVNKYGPREWSSIRSMGLLPRTGKSCRLRWVNKLRPNLKTGCKFSAEEERMVIELQAQFGNKWAKIATYLQGRTDNDVKNFWSTRRKRLERILQTPQAKSEKNKGKTPVLHGLPNMDDLEVPTCSSIGIEQESSLYKDLSVSHSASFSVNSKEINMVPLENLMKPHLQNSDTNLTLLEDIATNMVPSSHYPFAQFPPQQLDLPILPKLEVFSPHVPSQSNFFDMFEQQEASKIESEQNISTRLLTFGLDGNAQIGKNAENENPVALDSFFDEFPTEMLDYLDNLPSSPEL